MSDSPGPPGVHLPLPALTLLLRRVAGPSSAPALALLAVHGALSPVAAGSAPGGVVYALVDVAAPDGSPVGAALVSAPGDDGQVEVVALAVVPAYRRRGLGARILAEAVDASRARGVSRVVADVNEDAARGVFVRAGFTGVGPHRVVVDL